MRYVIIGGAAVLALWGSDLIEDSEYLWYGNTSFFYSSVPSDPNHQLDRTHWWAYGIRYAAPTAVVLIGTLVASVVAKKA